MSVSTTTSQPSEADIRRIVPWLLYVIFFSVLNETVFNVSTPSISEQFHLLPSQVSWVVTIFILFFGIGSIVFGKLSDLFSPKHLMVIGIAIYAASSVLGFIFHDNYIMVILFRAIQGLGASAIPAINNTIITRYFTATGRKKMFGLVTSAFSFGVAVGPVLGGYITSHVHWAYLFLIPIFTLAAIPFFLKILPVEERKKGKFDLLGAVLVSLTVTGFMLFLTQLNPAYLVCSLAAGIWFAIHIRAHAYPFLQTTLFKNPLYRIGVIIGFLMFSAIMTMMFLLPLMLSQLYALNAETIGAVMFPGAICAALCGKIAGDIVVKKGAGYVTFTGLGLIALGFALIWISIDQWVWWIAAALVVMNMGYAFSQTSITESVSSTLRGNQIGIGMGLFSLGMFIAQALGTAMAAKLLDVSFLAFPLHPFVMEKQSLVYVNLTLLMILVILCISFMYFLFSRRASQTSNLGAESHGN
ncbi:MFS transporter, DHA2 family, metal-tetracycline-proton antiporter [Cohnella sp. OV330]|uniref:MFS transporter n=1 Tax=Cohnella sp. OV330 TaxID=1855288 RepID=UPI0008F44C69|nr:MFS transporter [Cohnella sp. OV330]SFB62856.1 MFS transporter, DHA2 family, metal-tetracycline-proton antiporter [Cohnella sp. OV330]